MKNLSKYAVPFAVTLTGLFFTVYTVAHYQLYDATMGPMQGALPTGISALLTLFGLVACLKTRSSESVPLDLRNWSVVAAVGAVIAATHVIGFLPSIFVFLFAWLKFKERLPWKTTIIVTVVMAAFVLGVFVWWMQIPFTPGILFEDLWG